MAGNRDYSRGRAIASHGTQDHRGKGRGPPQMPMAMIAVVRDNSNSNLNKYTNALSIGD